MLTKYPSPTKSLGSFVVFGLSAFSAVSCNAQVLGEWTHLLGKCVAIEKRANAYVELFKDCVGGSPANVSPLEKMGPRAFRLTSKPKHKWYYEIAQSGKLEIRDAEGVVNTLEPVSPGTIYKSPGAASVSEPENPKTAGLSCDQVGFRYGFAGTRSFMGLSTDPNWNFAVPARCRNRDETTKGIAAGTNAAAKR